MYLIPLAWNKLPDATIAEPEQAFLKGLGAANLHDRNDLLRPCVMRGRITIVAGFLDTFTFNPGAGNVTATLNPGEYYSVTEACIELARAMNAVSTNCRARWLQGSTNRYRIEVYRTSGTLSWGVGDAAVLYNNFGFEDRARSAAASHIGDYAVTAAGNGLYGDRITATWSSPISISAMFVLAPRLSAGGSAFVRFGTAAVPLPPSTGFGDAFDDEIQCAFLANDKTATEAKLYLHDSRREDASLGGAAYWYIGPAWNSDDTAGGDRLEWSASTYERQPASRLVRTSAVTGVPFFSEVASGERLSIGFNSPGLANGELSSVESLITAAGQMGYVLVALDPTNEPTRETALCRFAGPPTLTRTAVHGAYGRWPVSFELERVRLI